MTRTGQKGSMTSQAMQSLPGCVGEHAKWERQTDMERRTGVSSTNQETKTKITARRDIKSHDDYQCFNSCAMTEL
jgi:hypothetical protein